MTLGGITTDGSMQGMSVGMLKGAMDMQAGMVNKLLDGGSQCNCSQNHMMQSAMADLGKGLKLDLTV